MRQQRLDETQLILARLNGLWSFTGKILSGEVERFLLPTGHSFIHTLLLTVSAYGCLTRVAGEHIESGYVIPFDWDWRFRNVGQALLFDIPATLTNKESKEYSALYNKAFIEGFRGGDSPSSPSP